MEEGLRLTLQDALRLFHDEFPGWWWKAGECRISCDADIAIEWYDVGLDGKHPDSDLFAPHRTVFDDGLSLTRCSRSWKWPAPTARREFGSSRIPDLPTSFRAGAVRGPL
jgi:hypothetical protein